MSFTDSRCALVCSLALFSSWLLGEHHFKKAGNSANQTHALPRICSTPLIRPLQKDTAHQGKKRHLFPPMPSEMPGSSFGHQKQDLKAMHRFCVGITQSKSFVPNHPFCLHLNQTIFALIVQDIKMKRIRVGGQSLMTSNASLNPKIQKTVTFSMCQYFTSNTSVLKNLSLCPQI